MEKSGKDLIWKVFASDFELGSASVHVGVGKSWDNPECTPRWTCFRAQSQHFELFRERQNANYRGTLCPHTICENDHPVNNNVFGQGKLAPVSDYCHPNPILSLPKTKTCSPSPLSFSSFLPSSCFGSLIRVKSVKSNFLVRYDTVLRKTESPSSSSLSLGNDVILTFFISFRNDNGLPSAARKSF